MNKDKKEEYQVRLISGMLANSELLALNGTIPSPENLVKIANGIIKAIENDL